MPRSGGGTGPYQLPAIYLAVPGTTILAAQHNTPLEDIANEFNQPYPIAYGGTFAATAVDASDNLSTSASVASAATTDLGNVTGVNVTITGTTTITSLGDAPTGAKRWVTFSGILILTYNATALILPGAANITTAAGDTALFVSLGSANWKCLDYLSAAQGPSSLLNAVQYTSQTLTAAQQSQARGNISADLLAGMRNVVINGGLDIWQRGTSFGPSTTTQYTADRWLSVPSGATVTVSRQAHTVGQTAVPGNPRYFLRNTVSVANADAGFIVPIEGAATLSGKTVTLTLYIKHLTNAPTSLTVEATQVFGTGGAPSASVITTVTSSMTTTTSFVKKQFVFALPSVSGKTFGTNTPPNDYLQIFIYNPTSQIFDFDISRMSLVEGDASLEADPFAPRNVQQEEAMCQRFYQVAVLDNGGAAANKYAVGAQAQMFNSGQNFNTTMRTVPTATQLVAPAFTNCTTLAVTTSFTGIYSTVSSSGAGVYRAADATYALSAEL